MKELVLEYYVNHHQKFEKDLSFFRYHLDFDTALKFAIISTDSKNRKFSHQHRIPSNVLENAFKKIMLNKTKLLKASTFDRIFQIIEETEVVGFGKLCCYDAALRIAEHRNIQVKHIYLQAGALEGAKKLCEIKGKRFIDKNVLPEPLCNMNEKIIEDFLCVMKNKIPRTK